MAMETERWNLLHPDEKPRVPYVTHACGRTRRVRRRLRLPEGAAQHDRQWLPRRLATLGTDGFGRSESRASLRDFFEVDARFITVATLHELAQDGLVGEATVQNAIRDLAINPDKPNPVTS